MEYKLPKTEPGSLEEIVIEARIVAAENRCKLQIESLSDDVLGSERLVVSELPNVYTRELIRSLAEKLCTRPEGRGECEWMDFQRVVRAEEAFGNVPTYLVCMFWEGAEITRVWIRRDELRQVWAEVVEELEPSS